MTRPKCAAALGVAHSKLPPRLMGKNFVLTYRDTAYILHIYLMDVCSIQNLHLIRNKQTNNDILVVQFGVIDSTNINHLNEDDNRLENLLSRSKIVIFKCSRQLTR